jgi:hypothetical protein
MKVGDRVKLTSQLVNPESNWLPVEHGMEAGLEGEIVLLNLNGPDKRYHQIHVKWDNGRGLALFPSDPFVVLTGNEDAQAV